MPNIASAKKRVRTTAKRTKINQSRRTRVRGYVRKVEEALAKGDKKAAEAALKAAEPEIMRGVSRHPSQEYRRPEGLAPHQARLQARQIAESFRGFNSACGTPSIGAGFYCPWTEFSA